jgi:hypothetical protein
VFAGVLAAVIRDGEAADPIAVAVEEVPKAAADLAAIATGWSAEIAAARLNILTALHTGRLEVDPTRLECSGLEVLVEALRPPEEPRRSERTPLSAIIGALRGAQTGIVVADAQSLAGEIERHDEDAATGAWIAPAGSLLQLAQLAAWPVAHRGQHGHAARQ